MYANNRYSCKQLWSHLNMVNLMLVKCTYLFVMEKSFGSNVHLTCINEMRVMLISHVKTKCE